MSNEELGCSHCGIEHDENETGWDGTDEWKTCPDCLEEEEL